MEIKPSKWKIGLPIYPPTEVSDNSTKSEYMACMRLGLYRYGMRRGFSGIDFSIQMGLAYHKYREEIEKALLSGEELTDALHYKCQALALVNWEDPPIGHKKEHLNQHRFLEATRMAYARIKYERQQKTIKVTRAEDSFDLELPFAVCRNCGWAFFVDEIEDDPFYCPHCGEHTAIRSRHGGRIDQFVLFSGNDYIRDFKNTSYKTHEYEKKFDPNGQIQGYVWAEGELSGRRCEGALIETVYHTKSKVEITQHYVDYSKGQQEQWIASQMMHEQFIWSSWSRVEELGYLAFPQNTNACFRFNRPCRFREACQMASGGEIDNWLLNNTIESTWDFMNPNEEEGH